jgi:NAD kinase
MSADAVTTGTSVKTVVLFTHTRPEQTSPAVRAAVEAAARRNCVVVASPDELTKLGDAASGIERLAQLPERPDLCLVLGGDGTILQALRTYSGTGVPVFGVNF